MCQKTDVYYQYLSSCFFWDLNLHAFFFPWGLVLEPLDQWVQEQKHARADH